MFLGYAFVHLEICYPAEKNKINANNIGTSRHRQACIDTSCDSGTSMLETYYSNLIARQLYEQKCMKYRKSQYWPPAGKNEIVNGLRHFLHKNCILMR